MKERNEINAARCKQQIEGDEMGWLLSLVVGYGRCSANGSAQERRQQQQPINSSSIMRNKRNGTTSELSSAAINLAAVQWREVEPPLPPRRDTFSSSPPTNEVKLVGYGPEAPLPHNHSAAKKTFLFRYGLFAPSSFFIKEKTSGGVG